MKRIKLLITLSLTLLVLAFGSISVFALDVEVGDIVPAGNYYFIDDIDLYSSLYMDVAEYRLHVDFMCDGLVYENIVFYSETVPGHLKSIYFRPGDSSVFFRDYWKSDNYRFITILSDVTVSDADDVIILSFLFEGDALLLGNGLAEDIFELFHLVVDWLVSAFGLFVPIFWNSTDGLTVLGVLAVIALGISIFFLIFSVVINFFRFRGR